MPQVKKSCQFVYVVFTVLCSCIVHQQSYKPDLFVIDRVRLYKQHIAKHSDQALVDLQQIIPSIQIELPYATDKNFTHIQLYPKHAKVFATKKLADCLQKVAQILAKQNIGIKVWDGYRPYSVTVKMWQVVADERYTANPAKGSGHNRGAAIDLTLYDLSTGKELSMPTAFDDFSEKAHHDFMQLSSEQIRHRALLKETMTAQGLVALDTEWWHYSLPNASKVYPLLDLSFNQLKKMVAR